MEGGLGTGWGPKEGLGVGWGPIEGLWVGWDLMGGVWGRMGPHGGVLRARMGPHGRVWGRMGTNGGMLRDRMGPCGGGFRVRTGPPAGTRRLPAEIPPHPFPGGGAQPQPGTPLGAPPIHFHAPPRAPSQPMGICGGGQGGVASGGRLVFVNERRRGPERSAQRPAQRSAGDFARRAGARRGGCAQGFALRKGLPGGFSCGGPRMRRAGRPPRRHGP